MIALLFVVTFIGVQWPFANFLTTPWARNWFFAADRMPYGVPPSIQQRWYVLEPPDHIATGLPLAALAAFVSARCGLWWGNWLSRVQR